VDTGIRRQRTGRLVGRTVAKADEVVAATRSDWRAADVVREMMPQGWYHGRLIGWRAEPRDSLRAHAPPEGPGEASAAGQAFGGVHDPGLTPGFRPARRRGPNRRCGAVATRRSGAATTGSDVKNLGRDGAVRHECRRRMLPMRRPVWPGSDRPLIQPASSSVACRQRNIGQRGLYENRADPIRSVPGPVQ
jgi:hypothetical protein